MPPSDPFLSTLQEWIEISMRRSMRNFIHYSKQTGLTMSQSSVLFLLYRKGARAVSDIADHLGISSAAASQMLERMVQQGVISRSEDPHDRRVKQILLTPKGQQVLQGGMQARQSWLVDLAEILTQAEQEQVWAALDLLIEKARQLEQHPEPEF